MYYQLFRELPSTEDMKIILEQFGIDSELPFGYIDLTGIVNKVIKIKPILQKYYLSCKYRLFVEDDLNEKKCITILRQFLKIRGYMLKTNESGLYYVAKISEKEVNQEPVSVIIRFD